MSKYLGSHSIPTNERPSWIAATPVVPLPMNGSRMLPFKDTREIH